LATTLSNSSIQCHEFLIKEYVTDPVVIGMDVMVLAAYSIGRRSNLFDTFTFVGLNKVGIWSV
jgi:uncharacterized membrane protein YpjA